MCSWSVETWCVVLQTIFSAITTVAAVLVVWFGWIPFIREKVRHEKEKLDRLRKRLNALVDLNRHEQVEGFVALMKEGHKSKDLELMLKEEILESRQRASLDDQLEAAMIRIDAEEKVGKK